MKKLLLLLLIAFAVFVAVYHQRLFLWDPIANVTRDGHKVPGARVRINYTNDILLEDHSAGDKPGVSTRMYLVQNWNKTAVAPARLRCVGSFLCMTDADQASGDPIASGTRGSRAPFAGVTMTNRRVEFVDEDGALVEVLLR